MVSIYTVEPVLQPPADPIVIGLSRKVGTLQRWTLMF